MKVAKVAAKKAKTVAKKAKTVAKPRVSAKKAKTNAKVAAKPKKYNIRGGVVGSSSRKSSPIQEETELEKEAERLN